MADEWNPFTPGTGLKDDFDATIIRGQFVPDPQSTRVTLKLWLDCDDGEEYELRLGLGNDWDTFDGGDSVKHPKGDRQLFHHNTQYSDFIVHAMNAGAQDAMFAHNKNYNDMGPRFAAFWVGFRFHFNVLQRPSSKRSEKVNEDGTKEVTWEDIEVGRVLPTKYLGIAGDVVVGTDAAAPSAPTNSDPLAVLDQISQGKVRAAAKSAADYGAFIDLMLALTDNNDVPIMDYDDVQRAVADESWYAALHTGE